MQREFKRCQDIIDERLGKFFSESAAAYGVLLESMRYSLLAGGKRIRAVLCLKFCEAAGGDPLAALDAACAIEMLHTYSLIHDDLPCMDNDDIRRGRPSNHIKFNEFTATLAGDALQAEAFNTLLNSGLPPSSVVKMGQVLAEAAGPHGICGGQYLDLSCEGKQLSKEELSEIHRLKTAALISASAKIGVIAAGGTQEQITAAQEYASAVGLAFQIRDDLLDLTSTTEKLGKPAFSDADNEKTTFATIFSEAECEAKIAAETEKAIGALGDKISNTAFLIWFARMLAERKS